MKRLSYKYYCTFFVILFVLTNAFSQHIDANKWLSIGVHVSEPHHILEPHHLTKIERRIISIINRHGSKINVSAANIVHEDSIDFTLLTKGIICLPQIEVYSIEEVDVGLKKVTVVEVEFSILVKDVRQGNIYSETSMTIVASGENTKKALTDFIRQIRVGDRRWEKFVKETRDAVLSYYNENCQFLMEEAGRMKSVNHYEDAWLILLPIPTGTECYDSVRGMTITIYRDYIKEICDQKLLQAEAMIANQEYAEALRILAEIIGPTNDCKEKISTQIEIIKEEVELDEKAEYQKFWRKWDDEIELRKLQMENIEKVSVNYLQTQYPQESWFFFTEDN